MNLHVTIQSLMRDEVDKIKSPMCERRSQLIKKGVIIMNDYNM